MTYTASTRATILLEFFATVFRIGVHLEASRRRFRCPSCSGVECRVRSGGRPHDYAQQHVHDDHQLEPQDDVLYGILDGCFGVEADTLSLLYKANVEDGSESGVFTSSYTTTFTATSSDPENALIEYVGGAAIGCVECYLVVKDGNHQPAQYFYDLSGLWNGTDSLYLKGFWPQGGAISNVAIWGTTQQVPEPGTLLLLGTGAAVAALRRRRTLRA